MTIGLHWLVQQLHLLVIQRLVMGPSQLLPHLPVSLLSSQHTHTHTYTHTHTSTHTLAHTHTHTHTPARVHTHTHTSTDRHTHTRHTHTHTPARTHTHTSTHTHTYTGARTHTHQLGMSSNRNACLLLVQHPNRRQQEQMYLLHKSA